MINEAKNKNCQDFCVLSFGHLLLFWVEIKWIYWSKYILEIALDLPGLKTNILQNWFPPNKEQNKFWELRLACNSWAMFMRGSSKAAPYYSLLFKKKPPTVNKQIMTPPKLRPKKYVGCSFQNYFDTWCQNCTVWLSSVCLCQQMA